jgi:hypothetical protein
MAILNFASRRVRPLRIFFVYRSSTNPGPKERTRTKVPRKVANFRH